ncbi:hypothetical protein TNCV_1653201 [Trichonephila clavipes]|nr:hypothetical protein TNCV_1653201 [Trichonephila clavipes]
MKTPSGLFLNESPLSGIAVTYVGVPVAWESRIIDTAVATPLNQICIATHGRKRLRSALGGGVHKSIEENRLALP